ncbi:cytochrome c-type biogenesis protein CcmH [Variovorax sp. J22R133]|uniref:cytochrome c-type biogenesis protein n=1 Tax=Variovorax brevis TaxID=3053503 RepID=UPI0025766016|nr:cytochrome c-type biogenesis protein [Variovorax sp. J22R133]MDM0113777.1 cytochrome c-type biogenesis protein CcmH [Variovorax sp. J22R133]
MAKTTQRMLATWTMALAMCMGNSAHAVEALPLADDPALETRVMQVAEELRCLVCQNETLAASQSALAADLRKRIGRMLSEGQSRQQVLDFMVARYGEFVLYKPMWELRTLVLWMGPFAFLVGALLSLFLGLRKQAGSGAPADLSDDERLHAQALLEDGAGVK